MLGVVAYTLDPNTKEEEAGRSLELEASLIYKPGLYSDLIIKQNNKKPPLKQKCCCTPVYCVHC